MISEIKKYSIKNGASAVAFAPFLNLMSRCAERSGVRYDGKLLFVLDSGAFPHRVVQNFFADTKVLGSYLQKLVRVDEIKRLLQT